MNTVVEYMYRDGGNNKQYGRAWVSGILTMDDLLPFLHEGLYFVPKDVGLSQLRPEEWRYDDQLDHPWHEVLACRLRPTSYVPQIPAAYLLDAFRTAAEKGWPGQHDISW